MEYRFQHTDENPENVFTTIVAEEPSCTCNYFVKETEKAQFQVCEHLYAVYIYDMNANINQAMAVHQPVLTKDEVRRLIGAALA
jgi:hypothetical protein